jgi:HD-GYP domain-containing protein (c-di-GMP phosphodiesterase class II)
MVKLSDIIRLGYQKPKKEKGESSQKVSEGKSNQEAQTSQVHIEKKTSALEFSKVFKAKAEKKESLKKETITHNEAKVSLSRIMNSMHEEKKDAKLLYKKGLLILKDIFEKVELKEHFDIAELTSFVRDVVDEISIGKKELIKLALVEDFDNSLWQHSVNTCILSIDIGLSLGYNKIKLNELGISACLYDLGLVEIKDLISKPKKLSLNELSQVKKHPTIGANLLEKISKGTPGIVKKVILEHHERADGSGYPKGIRLEDIHKYAQIIGLIDYYEALTHPRPYRQALSSHEAIKNIITKQVQQFDSCLLKALVKKMSLYPIGSWVKLNTNEVGKVVEVNEDFPLRPIIRILFDSEGKRLDEIKTLDLSKNQNIYIGEIVDLAKLSMRISVEKRR